MRCLATLPFSLMLRAAAIAVIVHIALVMPACFAAPPSGDSDAQDCVLLHNGNVLFGEAETLGGWVTIRNGKGNVIRLRQSQVACVGETPRELYRYRIANRREGDPRVHLRDARWCLRHGLFDLAAEELRTIYRIAPDFPDALIFEDQFRSMLAQHRQRAGAAPSNERTSGSGGKLDELPRATVSILREAEETPPAEIDGMSLQTFARHVQPLLLNRCGRCHSHMTERDFQLVVPALGRRASARMTRENLQTTLRYVVPGYPNDSELVTMASTAHGGAGAEMTPRQSRALDALKQWVRYAGQGSTQQVASIGNEQPVTPAGFAGDTTPFNGFKPAEASPEPREEGSVELDMQRAPKAPRRERPSRLPEVDNPFDPELFNRRYHRN